MARIEIPDPIDWDLLREQRDTLISLAHPAREEDLDWSQVEAIKGVRNLLDALLDTHDDEPTPDRGAFTVEFDGGEEGPMNLLTALDQMSNAIIDDYQNERWGGIFDENGLQQSVTITVTAATP